MIIPNHYGVGKDVRDFQVSATKIELVAPKKQSKWFNFIN